jgi:hypothetical protein
MKIIHATWEKRNLGCDAWEVILEKKDMTDVSGVIEALHNPQYAGAYVCLKLPVGNLKMVHALEDDGWRFLEVQHSLIDHFTPTDVFEQREKLSERLSLKEIEKTDAEWERIIEKITSGMFDTDRISLDPAFGPEIACIRYKNWIRDLMKKDESRLMVGEIAGQDVSFSVELFDGKCWHGVLGGVFAEYKNSGIGMFSMAGVDGNEGSSRSRTVVSSNNPAVVRAHQNCGRIIYKEMYVFRKLYWRSPDFLGMKTSKSL